MELNGQINETVPRTYCVRDWVGPTSFLHAVDNKKTNRSENQTPDPW